MPAKKRKPTPAEIDRMRRLEIIVTGHGAGIDEARKASLDTLDARLREYGIEPDRYDAWDKLEIAAGILDDKPGPLTVREILNRLEGRAAARQSQAVEESTVTPTPETRGKLYILQNPDGTMKGLAKAMGIARQTLYKRRHRPEYKMLINALGIANTRDAIDPPHGVIDADGGVEAVSDDYRWRHFERH